MDLSIYTALETVGAVSVTVFLVSAIKGTGINVKLIPIISLLVGIGIVFIGSLSGLLSVQGWPVVWYGMVTGIMATGGWSSVKNVAEGIKNENN